MALKIRKPSSPPTQDVPLAERIASSFKQLAGSSQEVNAAAEDLCNNLAPVNKALRKLNLGVSAWHKFAGHEDENGNYWTRDIGYVKAGTDWGIALRRTSGNEFSDYHDEDVWPFEDAPRWMQIDSVSKIPDLFEELIKRTDETVKKLQAKSLQAKELSEALNTAIAELSLQGK